MYLYTDAVYFAQFGSKVNRRSRSTEIVTPPDDKVPTSPKSIYRLADKVCVRSQRCPQSISLQYDAPALKTLALNQIRSELAKCDIVEEVFSRFASR